MNGSIPVLTAQGPSLAEAWENSMVKLFEEGCDVRTEYDAKDKDGSWSDPPSKDCTMMVTVLYPASEPAIHRGFPGGLEDLEEYRQEVVDGIKDHWVRDPNDLSDKRWEYTYHGRLTAYRLPDVRLQLDSSATVGGNNGLSVETAVHRLHSCPPIDQLRFIVEKLAKAPYSRRCNAVTWQPWKDIHCDDPACLQSIWCRILPDDDGVWHLNMNVRFRSRDAFDAAFMNMWAFSGSQGLQGSLAARIAKEAGREVRCGRYCDLSDSYHIYGKRLKDFEGFLKQIQERSFENRTWTREFAQPFFDEAKEKIIEKVKAQDAKYRE